MHKQQGWRKLENTVKQSRFKHLWELHKEWTEAEVSASRVTARSDIFRKRVTKPLLKQKHHQKHLTWAKERNRIHVAWSPVWNFHSQWWFGLLCHLWCWSTVFSEVHSQRSHLPGNFRALHASFCWQALWRSWFHFLAGLGTFPQTRLTWTL